MSTSLVIFAQAGASALAYTTACATALTVWSQRKAAQSAGVGVLCRAPGLDIVASSLTWAPWVIGALIAGAPGVAGVIAGQSAGLMVWVVGHERIHREAVNGPRIVKSLNAIVGRWRNHVALWVSLLALPVFWIIRMTEIMLYPLLRWLLGFPRIRHADWITVSRHKFSGLVGHDLIWCLYCDWMTGVYSLGAEMLRTVESFWCPIRFSDATKCAKCRIDFPDIDRWVPADGSMGDVTSLLEASYGGGRREWLGHPARLTISVDRPQTQAAGRERFGRQEGSQQENAP